MRMLRVAKRLNSLNLTAISSSSTPAKRLSEKFETCIFGLNLVRKELDRRRVLTPGREQQYLM